MGWPQIHALAAAGVRFGSHMASHSHMAELSVARSSSRRRVRAPPWNARLPGPAARSQHHSAKATNASCAWRAGAATRAPSQPIPATPRSARIRCACPASRWWAAGRSTLSSRQRKQFDQATGLASGEMAHPARPTSCYTVARSEGNARHDCQTGIGPAGFRAHRAAAAGRRRARLLPGRRLSGAGRGRSASRLGRRHLDRRHQRGADRRQPAGARGSSDCAASGRPSPQPPLGIPYLVVGSSIKNDLQHQMVNQCARLRALMLWGAPSFFKPRMPPPFFTPAGSARRLELLRHLAAQGDCSSSLVDFDRINAGEMRFSVGAVNVRTGNFIYFDNTDAQDRPRAHHGQRLAAAGLSRPPRSTASTTGTAASSPTRRCNGCSTAGRARTRWPSRSICGARAASCRAT